jgi:tetratricopeptide (TPR) repeat protein
MRQPRIQFLALAATVSVVFLAMAGGWRWLCLVSNENAFLPSRPGAEWIIYPKPPDNTLQLARPVNAVFRRAFAPGTPPADALLTVSAFKTAGVTINGKAVPGLKLDGANWKAASVADVTKLIEAGTNEITVCVTNAIGPPAVWLRLQTDRGSWGSDEEWQVSLAGAPWQKACRATHPPAIQPGGYIDGSETTMDSLKRVWPMLVVLGLVAAGLVSGARIWWRRRIRPVAQSTQASAMALTNGLLIMVVIARIALFINNQPQLPRSMGFDVADHEKYIRFIQENDALPTSKDGWEMHQAPLYYAVSAGVLNTAGLSASEADAAVLLRGINGAAGLVHCWLALLCLRLLFPGNAAAQAAGLLIAAFLPPHLYLSQYVTNEPLAGLFATAAFYLCLRALREEKQNLRLNLGLGLMMGLALLTKFSSLLAVLFFPAALGLRLIRDKNHAPRDWLKSVGVVTLACLAVCGWQAGRLLQFGRGVSPLTGADIASTWWQDPGFRTGAYYLGFGQSLTAPLFSGFHSFADGFYSTLWGDGLISGSARLAFRPPWNYDLMNAEQLLALGLTFFLAVGFAATLARSGHRTRPEWLAVCGMTVLYGLGILYMSLHIPAPSEVKAFFAFPALVPFSALVAAGWDWAGRKYPVLRTGLWMFLALWAITAYASFWIRSGNPETSRVRGIYQTTQQNYAGALASLSRALQLNPEDADTHCIVAEILSDQGQRAEAVEHYREALRIRPDFPEALNNLALILATTEEKDMRDPKRAMPLAERACELTLHRNPDYLNTLAGACAQAGRFEEAAAAEQRACLLAAQSGNTESLNKNEELLSLYKNHQTHRDNPDQPESRPR